MCEWNFSPEAVVKSHKEGSSLPPLPADKNISCVHHHVQCLTEALCQKPCPLIGWMREPTAPPCTATPAWLAQIQDGRGVSTALPHPNLGRAAMNKVWSVSFLLRSKMADLPATPPEATRGTGYTVERWYRTFLNKMMPAHLCWHSNSEERNPHSWHSLPAGYNGTGATGGTLTACLGDPGY